MLQGFEHNGRWYFLIAGGSGESEGDGGDGGGDSSQDRGGATGGQQGDTGDTGEQGKSDGDGKGQDEHGQIQKALTESRARERKAIARAEALEKKEKDREEAEALKRGEHEKLLAKERDERAAEKAAYEAQLFGHRVNTALMDYLTEKHPEHVARAKWIRPVLAVSVTADMDETELAAKVKATADDYVKDHPIARDGAGAPNGAGKGGKQDGNDPLAKFGGVKAFVGRVTGE